MPWLDGLSWFLLGLQDVFQQRPMRNLEKIKVYYSRDLKSTQHTWGLTERSRKRTHAWAWGSAFIEVEGIGLGFHGLPMDNFKTEGQEFKARRREKTKNNWSKWPVTEINQDL